MADDYYQILDVPRDASDEEIRRAYRRMIKRCHPDLNPDIDGAEERLRSLITAYHTLSNRRRRMEYDKTQGFFPPADVKKSSNTRPSSSHYPPSLVRRREEAKKILFSWICIIIAVVVVYILYSSQYVTGMLSNRWSIHPVIYADHEIISTDPATVFSVSPAEDLWHIWYRRLDAKLLMGEMGTAARLSQEYAVASGKALSQGRINDAKGYAWLALEADPSNKAALNAANRVDLSPEQVGSWWLYRTLF